MLYSGGAEAVESALRLARAHTKKHEAIAFWGGFHGKTTGALALMGSDFKHGLGPLPPGNYLSPWGDLELLERTIKLSTTGSLAAIIVEPIQGTAGNILPPPGFLAGVRELAHEHGALFIADEMITGWGRTGRMFAQELYGVEADIMTFGKGVAAGFPVAGLVTRDDIVADADPWSRPSFSSSSYGGSPLAAAACDAVTRVIVEERLDRPRRRASARSCSASCSGCAASPSSARCAARAFCAPIDLVDPKTRAPLGKADCTELFRACLERGLLTMAYSPRVRINPPLVITEAEAREGVDILEDAMAALARRATRHTASTHGAHAVARDHRVGRRHRDRDRPSVAAGAPAARAALGRLLGGAVLLQRADLPALQVLGVRRRRAGQAAHAVRQAARDLRRQPRAQHGDPVAAHVSLARRAGARVHRLAGVRVPGWNYPGNRYWVFRREGGT